MMLKQGHVPRVLLLYKTKGAAKAARTMETVIRRPSGIRKLFFKSKLHDKF